MLAGPAVAQTTVTSNGRDGPTTCLNQEEEVNAANLPITALSTTSVTYSAPAITWNQYVGRLGDVAPPAFADLWLAVFDANTKEVVGSTQAAPRISSSNNYAGGSQTGSSLAAKTLYYVEVFTNSSGSIPKQVFARRCFMTGGTYTIAANPIASGPTQGSTGCYTISPLTIQHVRNCWCGRKTTLPLFSSTQDNTDWLNMWGCR